ncbi:MAG: DUF4476 domain-containing protein [Bacteroidetes bacterium]|nr:MAG: DUF4476 domain-containing protein [Bacteroidota bacterium]
MNFWPFSRLAGVLCSILFISSYQAQILKQHFAAPNCRTTVVQTDQHGNIYDFGGFHGSPDFDPGPGETKVQAMGKSDLYIRKLDANGRLLWVKQFIGATGIQAWDAKIDNSGNIYVTGFFLKTADFDPGPGEMLLTARGNNDNPDIFVMKLGRNGDLVWVKQIGAAYRESGHGIEIGKDGDIYVVGTFRSRVDFDPGPGTYNLSTPNVNTAFDNGFFLRLKPNGDFVWAQQFGNDKLDKINGITVDKDGNFYLTGFYTKSVDLDMSSGVKQMNAPDGASFIMKLDHNANLLWVQSMGQANFPNPAIRTDSNGDVIIAGGFQGSNNFAPGNGGQYVQAQSMDAFVTKFSRDGQYKWLVQIGGSAYDDAWGLAIDPQNNIYVSGKYGGRFSLKGTNFSAAGKYDAYIAKIASDGTFLGAGTMGGPAAFLSSSALAFNPRLGLVYALQGSNGKTVDIDPGEKTEEVALGGVELLILDHNKIGRSGGGDLGDGGNGGGSGSADCTQPLKEFEAGDFARQIKDEVFKSKMVNKTKELMKGRCLTSAQALQILAVFSFEETKFEMATHLFSQIQDKANFGTVIDSFTYEANKKKLRELMK